MTERGRPSQLSLFGAPLTEPPLRVEYRRSPRARRMILRILPDGRAEAVLPRGCSEAEAQAFVAANRDWLANEQRRIVSARAQRPGLLKLAAVDEQWRLDIRPQPTRPRRDRVVPADSPGNFRLQLFTSNPDDDGALRKQVRAHLLERAKVMYANLMPSLAARMGSGYARLQVRDQRTRWGSCSSSGTISLNYAGLFLPPPLVHYLCVHELAHCQHMNHGPRFWALVERHAPGARRLDKELTRHQGILPRWLVGDE